MVVHGNKFYCPEKTTDKCGTGQIYLFFFFIYFYFSTLEHDAIYTLSTDVHIRKIPRHQGFPKRSTHIKVLNVFDTLTPLESV